MADAPDDGGPDGNVGDGVHDPPNGSGDAGDGRSAAHRASLAFEYPSASRASIVERAVREEVDDLADERARASVTRDGACLRVDVTAADLVALRAGANTWLGLVGTAEDAAAVATDR